MAGRSSGTPRTTTRSKLSPIRGCCRGRRPCRRSATTGWPTSGSDCRRSARSAPTIVWPMSAHPARRATSGTLRSVRGLRGRRLPAPLPVPRRGHHRGCAEHRGDRSATPAAPGAAAARSAVSPVSTSDVRGADPGAGPPRRRRVVRPHAGTGTGRARRAGVSLREPELTDAGSESGMGVFVSDVLPQDVAKRLRPVEIDSPLAMGAWR